MAKRERVRHYDDDELEDRSHKRSLRGERQYEEDQGHKPKKGENHWPLRGSDPDGARPMKAKEPAPAVTPETFDRIVRDAATEAKIEEFEEGLAIAEHGLDEGLKMQPDLFYRVSKELALAISRRDAAKQYLATVEAREDANLRRSKRAESDADEKKGRGPTNEEIKALVRMTKDVTDATDMLLRLTHIASQWLVLKEAFQQRGYVLKDLCALWIANYYTESGATGKSYQLRNHEGDAGRREMAQERQRRTRTEEE